MERASPIPLPIPRLRLNRQSTSFKYEPNDTSHTRSSRLPEVTQLMDMELSGLNNPNSLSNQVYPSDEDEKGQFPTPRIRSAPPLSSPAETPAARLRALLALVPNQAKPTTTNMSPSSHTPSEFESDYEPPESIHGSPSIARESLKDIFSRALRDPGDTPMKEKMRRNSIDVSEVEGSPRIWRTQGQAKGKRRSLSDEETDNQPKLARSSFSFDSFKHPTRLKGEHRTQSSPNDESYSMKDDSVAFPKGMNSSHATPPAAISTPQDSLRMSVNSQVQFQSNLLDQDSEMQRAIEGFNSSNGELSHGQGHAWSQNDDESMSEESPSHNNIRTVTPYEKQETLQDHNQSDDLNQNSQKPEHSRYSERGWIKRKSSTRSLIPELKPGQSLSRRSFDGASSTSSSRRGSVTSLRSNGEQEDGEKNSFTRTPSTVEVDTSKRSRTKSLNHLTRPESAQSHRSLTSPEIFITSLRRHGSGGSFKSNASGGSSVGSLENPPPEEITHERERNWNAPRPSWSKPPQTSNRINSPVSHSTPFPYSKDRIRVESLGGKSPSSNSFSRDSPTATSRYDISHRTRHSSFPALRESPSDVRGTPYRSGYAAEGDFDIQGSSFASGFVPNRPPLSPFSSSFKTQVSSSHPRSSTTPSPALSATNSVMSLKRNSSIPVWSPKKVKNDDVDNERSPSAVATRLRVPATNQPQDSASGSSNSPVGERTPTLKTLPPIQDVPDDPPPEESSSVSANAVSLIQPDNQPSSTGRNNLPPTPDVEMAILSTPPRKPSLNTPKTEYKTPSPPKGLPELPGPPSSSEDEEGHPQAAHNFNWTAINTPQPPGDFLKPYNGYIEYTSKANRTIPSESSDVNPNGTLFKTPRPPGAWAATPASNVHRDDDSHIPSGSQETEADGLATPVASLSKGSSRALITPAPPGAWAATPAARKGVMKVRFDPHHSVGESNNSNEAINDPQLGLSNGTAGERASSVGPGDPVSSPSKSTNKPTNIRVLDAFGRETISEITEREESDNPLPSKNKSAIRIVDAMGREVGEPPSEDSSSRHSPLILDRSEVLSRVRRGLDNLVKEISELDRADEDLSADGARIEELNKMSRASQEARERTALKMYAHEEELKRKLASGQSNTRRGSITRNFAILGWKFVFLFITLQFILYGFMYRATIMRTKEMFLSTYYDPFDPDLHIYTSRNWIVPVSNISWLSLPGVLYREGWKSCSKNLQEKVGETIFVWQRYLWDVWGERMVYGMDSWPPT